MDYKKAAQQVLDNIGGASNIVSAAHCATRLRLVIADNSKVNKKELENAEGAKGVFEAQGQLQIIFGTGIVNKVYDEFTAGRNHRCQQGGSQTGCRFQSTMVPAGHQDAGRYLCSHHPGHRGFRLFDGHYGSAELYGQQRLPEH